MSLALLVFKLQLTSQPDGGHFWILPLTNKDTPLLHT